MGQIHLFPTITDWIELEAKSPKRAFWKLMLEECMAEFWIIKESGAGDRVLDRRRWGPYPMAKALKLFERKIREKLNPDRASPRKYKIRRRPPRRAAVHSIQRSMPHAL